MESHDKVATILISSLTIENKSIKVALKRVCLRPRTSCRRILFTFTHLRCKTKVVNAPPTHFLTSKSRESLLMVAIVI